MLWIKKQIFWLKLFKQENIKEKYMTRKNQLQNILETDKTQETNKNGTRK